MRTFRTAVAVIALLGIAAAAEASTAIWRSSFELQKLPMTGPAWGAVYGRATLPAGTPNLSNQDDLVDQYVLAKALVYARTGYEIYRTQARAAIMAAIGTEANLPADNPDLDANGQPDPNRTLALGRNLCAYVIAAELVGLTPAETTTFKPWLRTCLTETFESGTHATLITTHEQDPNNWGTMCGASRLAACIYLGLTAQTNHCSEVFMGWLGDSSAWDAFGWNSNLTWMANPATPRAVNPMGSTISGVSVDGALPEEMRRGGSFANPPAHTGYPWEAMQGVVVQAEILDRQGYDSWSWSNQAVRRALQYLWNLNTAFGGWWATSDDQWIPWVINKAYGTTYTAASPTTPGKIMSWTDWTHGPTCVP